MPNVTFANWGRSVKAGPLANLRKVAQLAGISLYTGLAKALNCHGAGLCGTCKVVVDPPEALTPPTKREEMRKCTGSTRLACQAAVVGDVTVVKTKGGAPVEVEGVPRPTLPRARV
jgi:ferredoxin